MYNQQIHQSTENDPSDVECKSVDELHDADMDIDVEVIGDGANTMSAYMMSAHHPNGVTIISAEPLDQSVRESIRSVLISAGNDSEVTFIDGSGDEKHVKIVRKRIDTTL